LGDRPLNGLLVADFGRILAGPLVTQNLAELGARVVKVERPGTGDDTRAWGPPFDGDLATYFTAVNRGKESIALDLADTGDLGVARRLAERADVLVENFRPGLMDRFGLDYESLRSTNPKLIYCSISAFGKDGPGAGLPGVDLLIQAMAGWMHVTGQPDGPPTKVGMAVVDVLAGMYATSGVMAALFQRAGNGGKGQQVHVSLYEAALSGLINLASGHLLAGDDPHRNGNRHPSIAPYELFHASDRAFVLAAVNDSLFARTCEVIDRAELVADPRFDTNHHRRVNVEDLVIELEKSFRSRRAAEWIDLLRRARVPVGDVNTVSEAFELAATLGITVIDEDPLSGARGLRSPIQLSGSTQEPLAGSPPLDGHGEAIRRWLEEDDV
jgi:crotonobetainyl-CoA:carnitine CoA-transferase CaiB-like acyl-CoA transferase